MDLTQISDVLETAGKVVPAIVAVVVGSLLPSVRATIAEIRGKSKDDPSLRQLIEGVAQKQDAQEKRLDEVADRVEVLERSARREQPTMPDLEPAQ